MGKMTALAVVVDPKHICQILHYRPLAICKTKFVNYFLQVNHSISHFRPLELVAIYKTKFVNRKISHVLGGRTDGQKDRRTDRHDVTLEATPSKYLDGGLIIYALQKHRCSKNHQFFLDSTKLERERTQVHGKTGPASRGGQWCHWSPPLQNFGTPKKFTPFPLKRAILTLM